MCLSPRFHVVVVQRSSAALQYQLRNHIGCRSLRDQERIQSGRVATLRIDSAFRSLRIQRGREGIDHAEARLRECTLSTKR